MDMSDVALFEQNFCKEMKCAKRRNIWRVFIMVIN